MMVLTGIFLLVSVALGWIQSRWVNIGMNGVLEMEQMTRAGGGIGGEDGAAFYKLFYFSRTDLQKYCQILPKKWAFSGLYRLR